jgi:hypothetical protein
MTVRRNNPLLFDKPTASRRFSFTQNSFFLFVKQVRLFSRITNSFYIALILPRKSELAKQIDKLNLERVESIKLQGG